MIKNYYLSSASILKSLKLATSAVVVEFNCSVPPAGIVGITGYVTSITSSFSPRSVNFTISASWSVLALFLTSANITVLPFWLVT